MWYRDSEVSHEIGKELHFTRGVWNQTLQPVRNLGSHSLLRAIWTHISDCLCITSLAVFFLSSLLGQFSVHLYANGERCPFHGAQLYMSLRSSHVRSLAASLNPNYLFPEKFHGTSTPRVHLIRYSQRRRATWHKYSSHLMDEEALLSADGLSDAPKCIKSSPSQSNFDSWVLHVDLFSFPVITSNVSSY